MKCIERKQRQRHYCCIFIVYFGKYFGKSHWFDYGDTFTCLVAC